MQVRKIMGFDGGMSAGITLPKDDLDDDGLISNGQLDDGEHYAVVEKVDDGTYHVELVDELD